MEEKQVKFYISLRSLIFWVVVLAVYALVALWSYQNMNSSLFAERASNTMLLVQKISQNVETGIETRWNSAAHLSNQFADTQFESVEQVRSWLEKTRSYRPEYIRKLLVVDSRGICYAASGEDFPWPEPELLDGGAPSMSLVDPDPNTPASSDTVMRFLRPLPHPVQVEGIIFTHICLSTEMTFVDPFFQTEEFGEYSVAFILDRQGNQLYQRDATGTVAVGQNVRQEMKDVRYFYGASYEQVCMDIDAGRCGCVRIEYREMPFFLVYHSMEANDWITMMFIPEKNIGSSSQDFMVSIIVSTVLIAMGGLAIFAGIIFMGNYRVSRQRKQVNDQLRRAVEAERSANEAKTRFLSSMSHDIRTPMNAIIGMSTLAARHIGDQEYVKNCIAKITLASNHLLTLINDVLDISKVEAGQMPLNPMVFSLADTANNLVNIVRQQIAAKDQKFDIRVHNFQREYLLADELRLNQIFINLLTNAVKYTSEGGTITVDLKQEPVEGSADLVRLIYVVEDDGIGMSPEFQQTMYDSFARATDLRVSTVQGTGLGLAICKQMVELMGGTIQCESSLGRGTRFTVTLELPAADQPQEDRTLPPMHVLLVDDDEIFLTSASDTLLELGLTADCVTTGEEAIAQVELRREQNRDYPAVIIDWHLPGLSGLETARAIRERVGPEITIILISAYDFTEIEEQVRDLDIDGFISKPFFPSTVYRDMSRFLGAREEPPAQDSGDSLQGLRVLIAEDNDLNWEIVREILAMYGVHTFRAANGRECVRQLEEGGEFDAVLMDIQMPVMNGYEATACIRRSQNSAVRNIPIIAMTADAFADDIQRCAQAGMNGHVAKPIHVASLLDALKNRGGGSLNFPIIME